MAIHLRQVCLVAWELEPIAQQLSDVLGLSLCHRDPVVEQYGLENALFGIGTDFLEVVAPIKENTAAERYLRRLGSDGGYMVITQVDSVETQQAIRARALAARVRIAHEEQREGWSFCQLHPADMEAAFLDIEWDAETDFAGCWHPAGGHQWKSQVQQEGDLQLINLELRSPEPDALVRLWRDILGTGIDESPREISLRNAQLVFTQSAKEEYSSLSAITLRVANVVEVLSAAEKNGCAFDQNSVTICGTRFILTE